MGRYNLGMALALTGKRDEGLEHLQEAARLRPDWPAPRDRIARLVDANRQPDDTKKD